MHRLLIDIISIHNNYGDVILKASYRHNYILYISDKRTASLDRTFSVMSQNYHFHYKYILMLLHRVSWNRLTAVTLWDCVQDLWLQVGGEFRLPLRKNAMHLRAILNSIGQQNSMKHLL